MGKVLLFYDRDEFFDYKELKFSEGFTIESVSKYIKDNELIQDLNISSVIVDVTVLSEYASLQLLPEQIFTLFDEETIFIADNKHKEQLLYELRFVFDECKNVEKNYLKSEVLLDKEENKNVFKKSHTKVIDLEEEELEVFFKEFKEKLYGHTKFKDDFENQVRTFRIFNKLKEHKIFSLFLLGDSGVGKTEVARAIFSCLKGEKGMAKINFGNYSNEYSLSSLIGASRGYRDSEDGEIFMKVRDTNIGVLLIDEFEKANTTLFNYFLDVLETGIIEGSLGQRIDLNGFIIIFTSNISKEDFPKRISPELRSRFDYKCQFTLLSDLDKVKYIEFRVLNLIKKVEIEFQKKLPNNTVDYFKRHINVSKYNNMRDINKQIKKVFLDYIKSQNEPDDNVETANNFGIGRKLIDLFK
jgi:DNA replication protein DnaC